MEDKQVTDIERRIDRLRTELDGLADETAVRRARRREAGFDHVALAGYTNAGKSTLFQRLADDVDLGENETRHDDLPGTAEAADRLFETLGTTTRRATMDGRPVLVTDTVGFVSDLPHELVEAFESTLSAVWEADVVVNVVDVSDPPVRLRETVETSRDLLSDRVEGTVVTVCNKADAVDEESLADRRSLVAERVDDEPVVASAADGSTTSLRERIVDALPTERATVCVPNASAGMSVVSWAYDHATVEDVRYEGATCELTVAGRPSVVARVRSRATAARESVGFDGDPESVESDGRDTT